MRTVSRTLICNCPIKASLGNVLFFFKIYLAISLMRKAFCRLHYPIGIIAQCVRGYSIYALSRRNHEEMMAECGVIVDHSTPINQEKKPLLSGRASI